MTTPIWRAPVPEQVGMAGDVIQLMCAHPGSIVRTGVVQITGPSNLGTVTVQNGQYLDQPFTTGSSQTTLGRVEFNVTTVGTGCDVQVTLQTDNGSGQPSGTVVNNSPTVILPYNFVGINPISIPFPITSLTINTIYHLIIQPVNPGSDNFATNYLSFEDGAVTGLSIYTSTNGTSWISGAVSLCANFWDFTSIGYEKHFIEDSGAYWVGFDWAGTLPTVIRECCGTLRSIRTFGYNKGKLISIT